MSRELHSCLIPCLVLDSTTSVNEFSVTNRLFPGNALKARKRQDVSNRVLSLPSIVLGFNLQHRMGRWKREE
jgi:hypothetical protein